MLCHFFLSCDLNFSSTGKSRVTLNVSLNQIHKMLLMQILASLFSASLLYAIPGKRITLLKDMGIVNVGQEAF